MEQVIRVINRRTRYAFDGETGICILAETPGTIGAMTVDKSPSRLPSLTVHWDAAICQDKSNTESTVISDWQESEISPRDVKFAAVTPEAAGAAYVDSSALALIAAVRSRLNDDRALAPGEKFDLGRKLDAALLGVTNG